MNKKNNPDLVRKIHYLVRLNKAENELFHKLLRQAGTVKPIDFIREMITGGVVISRQKKEEKILTERVLTTMIEYRTNFKHIKGLIESRDPSLSYEIEKLVKSMQKFINTV